MAKNRKPPTPPVIEGDTIQALVLFDSVYGKCGEVKPFRADEVEAIALAGFIDAHPNAVASAGG